MANLTSKTMLSCSCLGTHKIALDGLTHPRFFFFTHFEGFAHFDDNIEQSRKCDQNIDRRFILTHVISKYGANFCKKLILLKLFPAAKPNCDCADCLPQS